MPKVGPAYRYGLQMKQNSYKGKIRIEWRTQVEGLGFQSTVSAYFWDNRQCGNDEEFKDIFEAKKTKAEETYANSYLVISMQRQCKDYWEGNWWVYG